MFGDALVLLHKQVCGQATPWYQSDRAVLLEGDTLELLPQMASESADCIFADPPYMLSNGGVTCHAGKMVSVNKGDWDESRGLDENFNFTLAWLSHCKRILKEDGTVWVSGTNHNIFITGFALQSLGFRILNDIVWYKPNAAPNLSCRYFTHSHEIVVWASKSDKAKHKFDYKLMRQMNGGKQMRSVWEITAPKKSEKQFGKHPTQKPLALLERILLASTEPGDLVLDPFVGSGTTCVAALLNGRRSIGVDFEKKYLQIARRRIEAVVSQPSLPMATDGGQLEIPSPPPSSVRPDSQPVRPSRLIDFGG